MQSANNQLCCPVCQLRFNKSNKLPIFMQCCRKTVCESCVNTIMCQSSLNSDGVIPVGKFKCCLCQSNLYAQEGAEKHLLLTINDGYLDMIDTSSNYLPVYCDQYPTELASWYSIKSKQLISNHALMRQPEQLSSFIPFQKKILADFFSTAKSSLYKLN